jgi:hypothetical protein
LAAALAAVVLTAALLLRPRPAPAVERRVESAMTELMARIGTRAMLDPASAASSNPYAYVRDPAFDRIVALGSPALPAIERSIRTSRSDGLREYLLAIAGERIARVDLKRGRGLWQTGKEWPRVWRQHLKAVPGAVAELSASDLPPEEKQRRLVALGTPAAPFIADGVAAGRSDLAPALRTLAAGMPEVTEPPARVTPDWARRNKASFEPMRRVVAAAR